MIALPSLSIIFSRNRCVRSPFTAALLVICGQLLHAQGHSTSAPAEGPVRLHGANGRAVDFAGIWEVTPEGVIAVVTASDGLSLVPWDRFDLSKLRDENPGLEAARQRAIFLRSSQPVNLGLFAGILTPSQAGEELRRLLDRPHTLKVPVRQRTTSSTTGGSTTITLPRPGIYDGIIINPPAVPVINQTRVVTETRLSPDELTTSPRRVFDALSRSERVSAADRRELFDLVKTNPSFFEETAVGLERIAASLPPRHLLPAESAAGTLGPRLLEGATGLRAIASASTLQMADRELMRRLLALAENGPEAAAQSR